MSTLIDVCRHSQYEMWLVVHDDVRIVLHSENDGYAAWRHGFAPTDEEITLEQVAELERRHGKDLVRRVKGAPTGEPDSLTA